MTPLSLVQEHLNGTGYSAFLFGSRASGTAHSKSDWDIAIQGPDRLNAILLMDIEEAIEAANFSCAVDIVDLHTVSQSFREEILKSHEA